MVISGFEDKFHIFCQEFAAANGIQPAQEELSADSRVSKHSVFDDEYEAEIEDMRKEEEQETARRQKRDAGACEQQHNRTREMSDVLTGPTKQSTKKHRPSGSAQDEGAGVLDSLAAASATLAQHSVDVKVPEAATLAHSTPARACPYDS